MAADIRPAPIEGLPLPQERVPSASARVVGRVLAGAFLIVFVVNQLVSSRLEAQHPDRGVARVRAKWLMLEDLRGADGVVLGDSSGAVGVDPGILADRLGGRWVNLCTIGDTLLLEDVWMLDRLLARDEPPRRVVIVHVYDVWGRGVRPDVFAHVPLPWGYWDDVDPPLELSPTGLRDLSLARYAPLYYAPESTREVASAPLAWLARPPAHTPLGWAPQDEGRAARVLADARGHLARVRAGLGARLSRPNRLALERLVELTETHPVQVHLASSPVFRGLQADPDYRVVYARLQEQLAEYAARSDRLHLVFAEEQVAFPAGELENADHVLRAGARVYSRELAERLRAPGGEADRREPPRRGEAAGGDGR